MSTPHPVLCLYLEYINLTALRLRRPGLGHNLPVSPQYQILTPCIFYSVTQISARCFFHITYLDASRKRRIMGVIPVQWLDWSFLSCSSGKVLFPFRCISSTTAGGPHKSNAHHIHVTCYTTVATVILVTWYFFFKRQRTVCENQLFLLMSRLGIKHASSGRGPRGSLMSSKVRVFGQHR